MKRRSRTRPVMTGSTHRVTSFEIFFDLVFILALSRVTTFMGHPPTPRTLAQGLILLLLLWISWTNYTWLGNQARADIGLIRTGSTVAMAAIFLIALVIPDAWRHDAGTMPAPLVLALAYVLLTALHVALYFYAAPGDRRLRITLSLFAIATSLAWVLLVLGAVLGSTAQTLLWAGAFVINYCGGFLASTVSGWHLRTPSHFTERHGLALIIAFGESLIATGVGAGPVVAREPVIAGGLLAFIVAVCLWWLYFKNSGVEAGEALARMPAERRDRVAVNAYSLAHFPMIAGVIYLALGIADVLADLAQIQPRRAAGPPLGWISALALYGGAILYLAGRAVFLRIVVGSVPPVQFVALGGLLLLLPAARLLPALAALGLLTASLVALVLYERFAQGEHDLPVAEAVDV